ncbi:MAG: hypothetical protein WD045_08570 [Pirellulaceae bacterium]
MSTFSQNLILRHERSPRGKNPVYFSKECEETCQFIQILFSLCRTKTEAILGYGPSCDDPVFIENLRDDARLDIGIEES